MDCDEVFNVLTRGPFPSGVPGDVEVEEHLERCPDCWRLAEALRPAGDLFREAVTPIEGRDLPGYWGDAAPPGVVLERRLANGGAGTALAQRVQTQTSKRLQPYQEAHPKGWRDLGRMAGLLGLVTTAAVGITWLLG